MDSWTRMVRTTAIRKHCLRLFTSVLAKYSKSYSLIDCISVGVDRMQRNFEPMRKQVEAWQIALGKFGRGGTDDELRKHLIAVQR